MLRLTLLVLAGFFLFAGCKQAPPNLILERTYNSELFTVDKIYRSMAGPVKGVAFNLVETNQPELIWLTGFRSTVVNEKGEARPQDFMCHSNLVYRGLAAHKKRFANNSHIYKDKLFTVSQGEDLIHFPEGFGIPVLANLPNRSFSVYNQLLNVNHTNFSRKPRVRFRNTIFYIREEERTRPVRPLYQALGQVMVSLSKRQAVFNVNMPTELQNQALCGDGRAASSLRVKDRLGQEFSYHWKLKPGREERRTLISGTMLKLEYDTTIHYIVAHMHPFGVSLELRDLTAKKTLFKSNMVNFENKVGLKKVDFYSSKEGIPVYKDHEYALISIYNNTSKVEQDAMAIMYFFLHDKKWKDM